jgi:hypothetical protein
VAGAHWVIKDSSGSPVPGRFGDCPTATPLVCNFGPVNATQTVYLVAAFAVPATATGVNLKLDWNTTGVPPGDTTGGEPTKNKSHGDSLPWSDSVAVTSNGDAAGDFNINQQTFTVANDQKVTGKNQQATSITVNETLIGAAVGDSPSEPQAVCNPTLIAAIVAEFPWFSCSSLTTLTSRVEAGNGKPFNNQNGGPGIKVIITFAQAPSQLSGDHPFAYHYFIDSSGTAHAELITAQCTFLNGFPDGETRSEGCLQVNGKSVTVWLFRNGGMKN